MSGLLSSIVACLLGTSPGLACDHRAIDRGDIRGGPPLSHRFVLVNRGESEVRIVHLQPSCGCLTSRLTGKVLKPSESVDLVVHVATISQPEGVNLWTTTVFYRLAGSDVDHKLDLQIRANLVREVAIQPTSLRLSGKPGLAHAVQLFDCRSQPMEVVWATTSSPRLAVRDAGSWQRVDAKWVRTFHVRMSADCPPGRHEDYIQIVARDPDYQDIRIPVTLTRTDRQRVVASPPEIVLSPSQNEFMLILHDREEQPVEVEGVISEDPSLSVRLPSSPQRRLSMRVERRGAQVPQPWSVLRVQVRSPERQTVVIPVTFLQEKPRTSAMPGGER